MEQGGADVSRILCFNFFLMHIQMGCMVIALFLLCKRNVLVFSTVTVMIDTLGYSAEGVTSFTAFTQAYYLYSYWQ